MILFPSGFGAEASLNWLYKDNKMSQSTCSTHPRRRGVGPFFAPTIDEAETYEQRALQRSVLANTELANAMRALWDLPDWRALQVREYLNSWPETRDNPRVRALGLLQLRPISRTQREAADRPRGEAQVVALGHLLWRVTVSVALADGHVRTLPSLDDWMIEWIHGSDVVARFDETRLDSENQSGFPLLSIYRVEVLRALWADSAAWSYP